MVNGDPPLLASKAMSILTEIDTGHRTLEQGDPELRIIVDEIERLECQKYVLTQEVTRLMKIENAVLSDLRSPDETKTEPALSKVAQDYADALPSGTTYAVASTPVCAKCGQIDLRIPRWGIYHICPDSPLKASRDPCQHGNATGHCQHCLDAL